MAKLEIEVKFTIPVAEIPAEHRAEAERKARQAFVLELLRQGDISGGKAAQLLGVDRWQLSELMFAHGISPFDDTQTTEELEGEVADCLRDLQRSH
ncbi:MAG TPA: UPF0175 family protein [Oscillatoriaceae cyanobacterium M33_DOE_052]|uniref:Uncharacterized protein n=1 Tax=Planktothricoides sp. SpSt-374 TaxID=2282167 RepID=A0A7C3VFR2_9CYAN|nr:UPF0175 family protein [Oscillatoriaceae cyanobacterium M33_DOE_052]